MADRRRPAWALAAVIVRYLTTIQPHAQRELARWRCRALAIPDPCLRAHVVRPFEADQSAIGAALFAVLAPWQQQRSLVRLLVAYVLLWSYVDVRTERDPDADPVVYDALLDGLRDGTSAACATLASDDAGYLAALLTECRRGCAALPSWETVAPAALRLADDGRTVQAINHGPTETASTRLRAWAQRRSADPWHEVCAGASSPLALHALMALAAHPGVGLTDAHSTAAAYRPVSALGVFCDHLIDHAEDHALLNHSYVPYLGSPTARPLALHDLADRAARGVRQLRGERHTVILAAMAAMFLSRQQASSRDNAGAGAAILEALDPPAPQLLAALHVRQRIKRRTRCRRRADPNPPHARSPRAR
jgi:tetraprenyl-beta-curcumene synthase